MNNDMMINEKKTFYHAFNTVIGLSV